jgi:2'-5' RNA ligase
MTSLYVEFRLSGYAKTHARSLIWDVSRAFRVNGMTRRRPVPHVTLYPASSARNMRDVIHAVEKVGRKYTLVPFTIRGFGRFTKSRVIYLDIEASQPMKQLRAELARELNSLTGGRPESTDLDYPFHATIAFKDLGCKFEPIWDYISTRQQPDINQYLLRITVLGRGSRIVCEYDLVLKRTLSRRQALSGYWWSKTLEEMGRLQGRPSQGPSWGEMRRPRRRPSEEPTSIIDKVLRFLADLLGL